jgi:hypothetical protein
MKKIIIFTLVIYTLSACNREFKRDKDTSFVRQESKAENFIDELNSIVDEAANSGELSNYKLDGSEMLLASECAEVSLDTISFPRTVTIDFGDGCLGNDGRTRKGKILVNFTGPYRAAGTVITISTQNYFVENNQIIGNPLRVVENMGPNTEGHPEFKITVTGKVNFANNGGSIDWNSQRLREWTAGYNTFFLADDRYKITGSAFATNSNDDNWTSNIVSPLIVNMAIGCRQIVSGTILTTATDRPDREVDFGDGSCDNQFTVTINGNTYIISY